MKLQKAKDVRAQTPSSVVASQPGAAAAHSILARPSCDDLRARIAIRAYELYVERGCHEGGAEVDWLEAEREIMSREFSS